MHHVAKSANQPVSMDAHLSDENDLHCLVFRTDIKDSNDVKKISATLDNLPGIRDWNVDLQDWENVLRIECKNLTAATVIRTIYEMGFSAEELPL